MQTRQQRQNERLKDKSKKRKENDELKEREKENKVITHKKIQKRNNKRESNKDQFKNGITKEKAIKINCVKKNLSVKTRRKKYITDAQKVQHM